MTYRCQICNSVSPPNTPVLKIIEYKQIETVLHDVPAVPKTNPYSITWTPLGAALPNGQHAGPELTSTIDIHNPSGPRKLGPIKSVAREILRELPACKTCWDGHMSGLSVEQLIAARRPRDASPKEKGPPSDLTHVPLAQQGGTLFGRTIVARVNHTKLEPGDTVQVTGPNSVEKAGSRARSKFDSHVMEAFTGLADSASVRAQKEAEKQERFRQAYSPPPKSKKKSTDDLVAMEESGGKAGQGLRKHPKASKRRKQQDGKG